MSPEKSFRFLKTLGPKKFYVKKSYFPKFGSQKILVAKNFGPKKFWFPKNLGLDVIWFANFFVPLQFGSRKLVFKKISVLKKFGNQNNYGPKTI